MTTVNCPRCGRMCHLGPEGNPQARLLRRSATLKKSVCASCATTIFLKSIPAVMAGIERNGPQCLLLPALQEQFTEIMLAGQADAQPAEIDWPAVVEKWELP